MDDPINHRMITSSQELIDFCEQAATSPFIGFDTEFVSENRYRPQLCLIQIVTESQLAIVDTLEIEDVTPFWELLVSGDHVTLAHAAREEFLFCYRAVGGRPKNLFDIQFAAGMVGLEYPAAYGNLVGKLLNVSVEKGETRTDWAKRPLTPAQVNYALKDVVYLKPIYDKLFKTLDQLGRIDWLTEEITGWLDELEKGEVEPQWRRVPGISGMNDRTLAIVREIYLLRDEVAKEKNKTPRRILPDDLVVELARRGVSDPKKLKAIRGFDNRVSQSLVDSLSQAISRALALTDSELPERPNRGKSINLGLLGQHLTTALKIICDREHISAGIVGTAQDLRELAAWHLGMTHGEDQPLLASGWRAEIIGKTLEDIINGRVAIRVNNPKSANPLDLYRISPQ